MGKRTCANLAIKVIGMSKITRMLILICTLGLATVSPIPSPAQTSSKPGASPDMHGVTFNATSGHMVNGSQQSYSNPAGYPPAVLHTIVFDTRTPWPTRPRRLLCISPPHRRRRLRTLQRPMGVRYLKSNSHRCTDRIRRRGIHAL